jgi:prepilin-type N-terminal cleavage/methylation domain-containing protein
MKARSLLRAGRNRSARGYTLVELMMAIALFTVGVLAIISMQKLTVVSNAHSKDVSVAQRIAQSWASQLELDATQWRNTFGAGWLNSGATWDRPAYVAGRSFGGAFDSLGNPLTDSVADQARARFCTHVRMSWLYPNNGSVMAGNAMLRAEVRVFWLREGATPLDSTTSVCATSQTSVQAAAIGLATDRYHFVYQTVGVRQHSQI